MEHLPKKIHQNGISYTLVGDCCIPDLKLPEESRPAGDRADAELSGTLHRQHGLIQLQDRDQGFVQSGAEGYAGTGGAGHEGRQCVLPAPQQPDGTPVSGA